MYHNFTVHNKFEVSVVDVTTGIEKQTAIGYNTILDDYFRSKILGTPLLRGGEFLYMIDFGTGTGEITPSRTTLFSKLGSKIATTVGKHFAYPVSYIQKQIKLEANEYVGMNITEVGFYGKSTYSGKNTYALMTHALLKDSEGNVIAIHKTDVDIVYITATFYVSCETAGFGDNGIYPYREENKLVSWLWGEAYDTTVRFTRFPLSYSSEMSKNFTGSKNFDINAGTGDYAAGRYDLPITTFLDSECNGCIVKHLGIPGIGAITFPNHEILPPYQIDRMTLGTGDGVKKEYHVKSPMIMVQTEVVYVDGVEMVRDVDYTIDYESNCVDELENYATANMNCETGTIEFGNLKTLPPHTASVFCDPFTIWARSNLNFYSYYSYITEATPIVVDFTEQTTCNRFKIIGCTVPAGYIDSFVIDYSQDKQMWTRLTMQRSGQVWSFALTKARYWRMYIPGYTWLCTWGNIITTVNGKNIYGRFYLGKTVPGLMFTNPPPNGANVEISYKMEYPFKTANNLLRFTCSIQLQRG